jgi:hypothetical protein
MFFRISAHLGRFLCSNANNSFEFGLNSRISSGKLSGLAELRQKVDLKFPPRQSTQRGSHFHSSGGKKKTLNRSHEILCNGMGRKAEGKFRSAHSYAFLCDYCMAR